MDNKEAAEIIKKELNSYSENKNLTVDPIYIDALDTAIKALEQEPCEDAISRSEAIRIASGYCHWTNIPKELAKLPSVNPIPCEDAISRQAVLDLIEHYNSDGLGSVFYDYEEGVKFADAVNKLPSVSTEKTGRWIPVSERLPETDNKNSINNYNVLLWVKNKKHPEYEPQIYLGKLRHVDGDDGSGNLFGLETKPCDWTIWAWHYFHEPEVIAWMPLPQPYKAESEVQDADSN